MPPTRRLLALGLVFGLGTAASAAPAGRWFSHGHAPIDAEPPDGSTLSAESCTAYCHTATGEEWARSRHAVAFSNPIYAVSERTVAGQAWCRNCHAPLQAQHDGLARGDVTLASEGVNCAACHVRDGKVLVADPPDARTLEAHAAIYTPELRDASFCAGCHQFAMPDVDAFPAVHDTRVPMQDTYAEWRASAAADRGETCQTCHMPAGSHAFVRGAHDVEALRAAVSTSVRSLVAPPGTDPRVPGYGAEFTLSSRGVGHRFPTGDPFRRLVLQVCADAACAEVLGTLDANRGFVGDADGWRVGEDLSVPPPGASGATRTLIVPVSSAPPWRWRLTYSYVEPRIWDRVDPDLREVVLSEGEVAPP